VDPKGKRALVVGRSNIVGKPMAAMLLERHATVTVAHSRTQDLAAEVGRADILVAAIGKAEIVKGAWVKPGAVVVDVGMNAWRRGPAAARRHAAAGAGEEGHGARATCTSRKCARSPAITPVPGGVGPLTIAMLMKNTVRAARAS
jgi:methylenetetrahydrofolate dehydrogenase (NADP+)/methenyltetrahydrofolate cyclohydrolase